jgi:hypothetical protein
MRQIREGIRNLQHGSSLSEEGDAEDSLLYVPHLIDLVSGRLYTQAVTQILSRAYT